MTQTTRLPLPEPDISVPFLSEVRKVPQGDYYRADKVLPLLKQWPVLYEAAKAGHEQAFAEAQNAAAVSAAKDKEIAQLRAELIKSLADNAALRADAIDRQNNVVAPLRERVRVLEDACPEPDCRICRNFRDCSDHGYLAGWCKEGNQYEPLPPVRLWRTT